MSRLVLPFPEMCTNVRVEKFGRAISNKWYQCRDQLQFTGVVATLMAGYQCTERLCLVSLLISRACYAMLKIANRPADCNYQLTPTSGSLTFVSWIILKYFISSITNPQYGNQSRDRY
jgi:hypothetical protein